MRNKSLKTAFLLAVMTAKLMSEIHALSISLMFLQWKADGSSVTLWPNISFLTKVLSPSHINQAIELEAYHPPPFGSQLEERTSFLRPVQTL